MKIFFTTLCSMIFAHACLAQIPSQATANTDNLDAYVGTWEYATAITPYGPSPRIPY